MLAIDIALLLPPVVEKEVVAINKSLEGEKQLIDFGENGGIPHVTLCMGIVSEAELEKIRKQLADIVEKASPIHINYNGWNIGNTLCDIDIENTKQMYGLHKQITELMAAYRGREGRPDMFVNPRKTSEKTCFWTQNYYENSAMENFRPHITLGAGKPTLKYTHSTYDTPRLAIGQLGNYCTVGKVLFEWELG